MIATHGPVLAHVLLSLLAACAVRTEEPNDTKSKDSDAIPLTLSLPAKRPILCTRKGTATMTSEVGPPGAGVKVELALKHEVQFIDEHESVAHETETGTRLFVKTSSTTNGDVDDSCLAGVLLQYRRDGKNEDVNIVGKRTLSKKLLDDALLSFKTLGVWLDFPRKARIGESFQLDLNSIAPLLVSGEVAIESAAADVTFETYEAGCATFRGKATIDEKGQVEGRDMEAHYEGDCVIRTNPAEARILAVSLRGKIRFQMQDASMRFTGQGDYDVDLSTEIGEAVEKARKLKPTIRDHVFRVPEAQVAVKLPSFYTNLPAGNGTREYLRTRDSADGNAYVVIALLKNIPTPPKQYYDQLEAAFKQKPDSGFVSSQKVKSPLGEGRAYLLQVLQDGKLQKIRSEFYSIGKSRFVVFKLVGPPKAFAEAGPEFEKARKTLKVGS